MWADYSSAYYSIGLVSSSVYSMGPLHFYNLQVVYLDNGLVLIAGTIILAAKTLSQAIDACLLVGKTVGSAVASWIYPVMCFLALFSICYYL